MKRNNERPGNRGGPLWSLTGIWVLAVLFYGGTFYVSCHVWGAQRHTWPSSFGLSISSLFGFHGLGQRFLADALNALPWGLQLVAGFQTIAGFVLLFFRGLGPGNHFRLK